MFSTNELQLGGAVLLLAATVATAATARYYSVPSRQTNVDTLPGAIGRFGLTATFGSGMVVTVIAAFARGSALMGVAILAGAVALAVLSQVFFWRAFGAHTRSGASGPVLASVNDGGDPATPPVKGTKGRRKAA